jgi:predicted Fe-S protein YdhL (DUF1289 family)
MVKSPCIDVCRFEGRTGFCFGCLRTLEEARAWDRLTDHKRHAILRERSRREAKLGSKLTDNRTSTS